MILSKSCEYAIRASVYIAFRSYKKRKAGIAEIAAAIASPVPFTGKILQQLSRKKILSSSKGPNGGFFIEQPDSLYLIQIIRAIDGNGLFSSCALGLQKCSELTPCPLHHQISPIRQQLLIEFSKKSLSEMVYDYEKNRYFLR